MSIEEKSYNLDIEKECAKNHLERIIAIFKKYEASIHGLEKYDFIEQLKKDSEQGALKSKFEGEVDIPCFDWYYWKRVRYSGRLDENGDYILTISEEAYSDSTFRDYQNVFLYSTKVDYKFYRNDLEYVEYHHPYEIKDVRALPSRVKAPSYYRHIYKKNKGVLDYSIKEIYKEEVEPCVGRTGEPSYKYTEEDINFIRLMFEDTPIQQKNITEQHSILEEAIKTNGEYQIVTDGLSEFFWGKNNALNYRLIASGLMVENTLHPNYGVLIEVTKDDARINVYDPSIDNDSNVSYEELLEFIKKDPGLSQNKLFVQKVNKLYQLGCFENLFLEKKECAQCHFETIRWIFEKYHIDDLYLDENDFIEQLKKDAEEGPLKYEYWGSRRIKCHDAPWWKKVVYNGKQDKDGNYVLTISEEFHNESDNKFRFSTKTDFIFYQNYLKYEEYHYPFAYLDKSLLPSLVEAPAYYQYKSKKYPAFLLERRSHLPFNTFSKEKVYLEKAEPRIEGETDSSYKYTDEDKKFIRLMFADSSIKPKHIAEQYSILEKAIETNGTYNISTAGLEERFWAGNSLQYLLVNHCSLINDTSYPSDYSIIISVSKDKYEIRVFNEESFERSIVSYEELLELIEKNPEISQNKLFVQKVNKLYQLGCFENLDVDEKRTLITPNKN